MSTTIIVYIIFYFIVVNIIFFILTWNERNCTKVYRDITFKRRLVYSFIWPIILIALPMFIIDEIVKTRK